jgi:hypothetical protein
MVTQVARPARQLTHRRGRTSPWERVWTAIALSGAGVFGALAVAESPVLPLLGLVVGLGVVGGALFVEEPARSQRARQQYLRGALLVAGAVLIIIGVGHHLAIGLAVVGVLASCSPWTLRWITGGC